MDFQVSKVVCGKGERWGCRKAGDKDGSWEGLGDRAGLGRVRRSGLSVGANKADLALFASQLSKEERRALKKARKEGRLNEAILDTRAKKKQ